MKRSKDLLDKIEDFIENRIEDRIKKSLDEVESFVKRELRGENGEAGVITYLERFWKDRKVASVAPSTKFLIAKILRRMDLKNTKVVIEYGSAAGVVTRPLLAKLAPDARLTAIELNAGFAEKLRQVQDPRLTVVNGSVTEVDRIAAELRLPPADVIFSGIPFSFLSPLERHQLLHKTVDLLRPGGRFIAYQVTTHLVPLMKYHFRDVDIDFELRNIPPNFIFTGIK